MNRYLDKLIKEIICANKNLDSVRMTWNVVGWKFCGDYFPESLDPFYNRSISVCAKITKRDDCYDVEKTVPIPLFYNPKKNNNEINYMAIIPLIISEINGILYKESVDA
jgi:hypothetical protein